MDAGPFHSAMLIVSLSIWPGHLAPEENKQNVQLLMISGNKLESHAKVRCFTDCRTLHCGQLKELRLGDVEAHVSDFNAN